MTETQSITKKSKHDFYFETALYEEIAIETFEGDILDGELEGHSPTNNIETTYTIRCYYGMNCKQKTIQYASRAYIGIFEVKLECKRKGEILIFYILAKANNTIVKIGQYPSLADMQFSELGKKYDKVLPKEDSQHLKKAIGLHAHGAGAGSFVYLRRIFERLVLETYTDNKNQIKDSEEKFKNKRMQEKVDTLKHYLPSQLVEMKPIYGIMSKGVHELSEDECLKYFPAIKLSITLILDQKIKMKEESEKEKAVKKQIQDIQNSITPTTQI